MNTETLVLPAHWASALVNNDYSGLNEGDCEEIDTFFSSKPFEPSNCLSCSDEPYFTRYSDYNGLACDVLEYTFSID